jgi:hypothetical protein
VRLDGGSISDVYLYCGKKQQVVVRRCGNVLINIPGTLIAAGFANGINEVTVSCRAGSSKAGPGPLTLRAYAGQLAMAKVLFSLAA